MAFFLSPICNDQQTDANGNPLVGGKVFTYLAGSSTPAATYTDSTGATPQANPIILNSLGLPASPIWLTGGVSYKFVIKTAADVTVRTVDNVSGINDVSSTAQEWNESGLIPTYISATQFSVVGDQTAVLQVNRRLRNKVTAGYAYGRISASVFSAGVTTITMVNDGTPLDSGLTSVAYGFLSYTPSSVPFALYAEAGSNSTITALTGLTSVPSIISVNGTPTVRQTVLNGPVDTNGLSSFGGSTGSTTVTASGTLTATAANGTVNRTGSIVNPSWTSLSTNGTMYLYLDIAADGTCTTGSTVLAPTYRWGGADVTATNQFTFNIQEMVGKVGNGTTAAQTYQVFVGEVTVSGGVVTVITWYALMGRYDSGFTNTLPGGTTSVSRNHNLGYSDYVDASLDLKCINSEFGYPVGGIVPNVGTYSAAVNPPQTLLTRNAASFPSSNAGNPWALIGSGGGGFQSLTAANWAYRVRVKRGW